MIRFARRGGAWPLAVTAALAVTVAGAGPASAGVPAPAEGVRHAPPHVSPGPRVHGVYPVRPRFRTPANQAARPFAPAHATWPAASSARLTLRPPAAGHITGATATAAGSPVWAQARTGKTGYSGPQTLTVRVLSRSRAAAAGVAGVAFAVTPAGGRAGRVRIGVDYRQFAQAFGGNFGSRLQLAELPACALTTPAVAACRHPRLLRSVNDWAARSVSAQLVLGPASTTSSAVAGPAATGLTGQTVILAAVTSAGQEGSPAGSYAATTLKPSGTWTAGSSSGSFTYGYPITVPPAASSLVPQLALSYDSSRADGQTASTQAQASWAGDGWSAGESFIEQSFIPCSDKPEGTASPKSTSDECYDGPVLTLSLDGSATPLVCPDSSFSYSTSSTCTAVTEDGAVIKHVVSSGNGSGTKFTDYWTVTERDGTLYEFGRNELPGWASGKAATNSVASVPVYSAHSGDPCYSSSGFASSVCTMAYRWNLDYVKDVHGNAMAYYYNQSTNYYGEDLGAKDVSYIRDSFLAHIDYGFTDGSAYGTVADKIVFGTGDRCTAGSSACDPLNSTTAKNWPDVPFELVCNSGTTCSSSDYAPSFFSTVRLTSITAEQYSTASSSYVTVDSYALDETLPATGDGTSATLWLSKITRTGSDTTAGGSGPVTLPPVSFTGIDLQNRVDTATDGLPPLDRFRVSTVTTETGSVITPNYGQTKACAAPVTVTPSSNTTSCYPVYWTPSGYTQPYLDWFNSYVLNSVAQSDPTGGAPSVMTSYAYPGGAAWHYDDNEIVQPKYRTYGQFRGYGDVKTMSGNGAGDPQTLTEITYYRGMSDDNNTTAVTLPDSAGGTHADLNQLAGQVLEATSYLGNGGPADHSAITSYWVSAAVATRSRSGLPDLTANWVAPAETYTRQALTDGGTTTWRYTETDTTYDSGTGDNDFGLPTYVYTHTVPANPAYDRCTATGYAAANTGANLAGLVSQSETDSVACGGFTEGSPASVPSGLNTLTAPASVSRPAQVVSDTRTFYDDPTFSTTFPQASVPTKGDVTMTEHATGYSSGAFTYQVQSKAGYDSYGRQTASWDANGNKTTTSYAMNSVGLTTGTTVTNALSQATTTTLDTERGLTLTSEDPNSVVTTEQYDALGRVTGVWLASRATTSKANYTYAYTISDTSTTAVTTQSLNNESGYSTSVTIYDAMLRPRQTQTDTPQGGRLVTDTFYDTRGWVSATYNGWWDQATTPGTQLVSAVNLGAQVPNQDYYTYDGLGRAVIDNSEQNNLVVSSTTTVYNGDQTTVIPPAGGTVTVTVTDPLGRTSEIDQYSAAPTLHTPSNTATGIFYVTGGTSNATKYGYDGHGNQSTITDTSGDVWTSVYDLLGEVTSKTDPATGSTSMSYDHNGNLIQSTDARAKTISWTYDALDRKTGEFDSAVGSQSPANQLDAWVYDNSNSVSGVTNPVGHLTTATAYANGAAYTTQATGFNAFAESLGETVTIPSAAEGAILGTTYTFSHTYGTTTGLPLTDTYPAAGGLPAETVNHGYATVLDLPTTLGAGLTGYAQYVTYDAFGRVNQEIIGEGSNLAYLTDTFDQHTGNLTDQLLTRAVATPAAVDEQAWKYDPAGNITRQVSTRLGATSATETQCYAYDQLDRLTAAWTATDNCAATPTTASHAMVGDNLTGGTAYWTSWAMDPLGNRTSQDQHSLTGGQDTTTSYTYDGNAKNQPDTLTSTSGAAAGPTSYTYDASGNTLTRTTPAQGTQNLNWNDAGQLTAITGGSNGDSHYVYDASGNLLLQKDPGSTTLYLPGEQLTLNTTTQALTGVRYYTLPGGGLAYRTGLSTNYGFEIPTPQGTGTLTLDHTAQTPTWRQFTPYGEPRGAPPAWIDNHGYLNKPNDTSTALTIIGARQYDPATGRFISPDPVLATTSPQQLNGYSYAANNPTTKSDPTGLTPHCDQYGDCTPGPASNPNEGGAGGAGGNPSGGPPCPSTSPGCPGYTPPSATSSRGSNPRNPYASLPDINYANLPSVNWGSLPNLSTIPYCGSNETWAECDRRIGGSYGHRTVDYRTYSGIACFIICVGGGFTQDRYGNWYMTLSAGLGWGGSISEQDGIVLGNDHSEKYIRDYILGLSEGAGGVAGPLAVGIQHGNSSEWRGGRDWSSEVGVSSNSVGFDYYDYVSDTVGQSCEPNGWCGRPDWGLGSAR